MSELIRIVEGETFDKETADIIAKTEPEKVFQVGENEYAYISCISLNKLENGKYQYTIQYPKIVGDGHGNSAGTETIKETSKELYHPYQFPRKVYYFSLEGKKQKKHAFINIYGEEVKLNKDYASFVPDLGLGEMVINGYTESEDGERLDILLNEGQTEYAKLEFAQYLIQYSEDNKNTLFDPEYEGLDTEIFADDEVYDAIKKEERRRWVEAIRPKLDANPKYKTYSQEKQTEYLMKLPETKEYLARKKQIADLRASALNKAGVE